MSFYIFAEKIFFHELLHFFVALVLSAAIFFKYRSLKYFFLVWFVTFLIDLDHLTEWILVYKWQFFSILAKINGGHFREAGKMTIFFHSWELLPIIFLLGSFLKKRTMAMIIIFAMVAHLLTDQVVYSSLYGMSIFEYSLIYRAINNFDFFKLCGGC